MLRGIVVGFLGGGALGVLLASVFSLISPLPSRVELQTNGAESTPAPVAATEGGLATPSQADQPLDASKTAVAPTAAEEEDVTPAADQASAPRPTTADVADVDGAPVIHDSVQVEVSALEK